MFSSIKNILVQRPRRAESTDTRQEIRRHDPDQHRRRDDEDDDVQEIFGDADETSVSVSALRLFLEDFLTSQSQTEEVQEAQEIHGQEQGGRNVSEDAVVPEKPEVETPLYAKEAAKKEESRQHPTGQARRAINAYQTTARASGDRATGAESSSPSASAGAALLSSADVRIIHGLLEDLKVLLDQGVQTLTIERSTSFLQSLVEAAQKARHKKT